MLSQGSRRVNNERKATFWRTMTRRITTCQGTSIVSITPRASVWLLSYQKEWFCHGYSAVTWAVLSTVCGTPNERVFATPSGKSLLKRALKVRQEITLTGRAVSKGRQFCRSKSLLLDWTSIALSGHIKGVPFVRVFRDSVG